MESIGRGEAPYLAARQGLSQAPPRKQNAAGGCGGSTINLLLTQHGGSQQGRERRLFRMGLHSESPLTRTRGEQLRRADDVGEREGFFKPQLETNSADHIPGPLVSCNQECPAPRRRPWLGII